MTIPYEDSYNGQLRKLVGHRKLFAIGARAVLRDSDGRILLVLRKDNGCWVMPAGSMELGESVLDCLKREVKEETGLDVLNAVPIAIYSDPRYSFTTSYGDPYQMFGVVFLVERWEGQLLTETDETLDAGFFPVCEMPDCVPPLYRETIEDVHAFDGTVIVK